MIRNVISMTYDDRAGYLADMIEERLGVRGKGLSAKLKHAGRLLPKHVHRDAGVLVDALALQANPKLARRVDDRSVTAACKNVESYLSGIDPNIRRFDRIIGFLSSNALNLLVTSALVIGVLMWRGYL